MTAQTDVLIVGCGPAGSNLARVLAHQKTYQVMVLDKRALDQPYDKGPKKACGGLLSPDAQKMMAKLGLTIPKEVLEDPQLFSVRTLDFDNGLERYYQRYYYNMDREKFDRYLVDLIPAQVACHFEALVKSLKRLDEGWQVSYVTKGQVHHVTTKFLVVADGAKSFLRARIAPDHPKPKTYISKQVWYPLKTHMPYYTGIFDQEITDYYSWTIQKGNALILGTAIPYGQAVHQPFEVLRQKVEAYLGHPLSHPIKTEGAFIERSEKGSQLLFAMPGVAFIGEAAGLTSPTSAEGFSHAFRSSMSLAKALSSGLEGAEKRYQHESRVAYVILFKKVLKKPAMYNRFIRKWVMKSGLTALDLEPIPQKGDPYDA